MTLSLEQCPNGHAGFVPGFPCVRCADAKPEADDRIHALTLIEMRHWAATGQWPARLDELIRGGLPR